MTTGLVLQCISFHPSENYTVKICVPISCYINMIQDTGQKYFSLPSPPLPHSLAPIHGKREKPGASYKWSKMADEKTASGEMTEDEKKADEYKLKANESFKGMVL